MKLKVIVAVAVAVVLVGSVAFSQEPQAFKLEGAWVARVTSYEGWPYPPRPYVVQWSYVLQPDPSGRRATLHGSVDLGLPSPPGPLASPLIGECVMTGPGTARCFVMWYSVLKSSTGGFDTLMGIGTVTSDVTAIAPGSAALTHHFAIYSPGQDADGDGFPDPDQVPYPQLGAFNVTTHDTRLPQPVVQ